MTLEENDFDLKMEKKDGTCKDSETENLNNFEQILELVFEKVQKLVGKIVNEKFKKLEEKMLKGRGVDPTENGEMVGNTKSEITKKLVQVIKDYKANFVCKFIL
jgi:hypothetical protein